MATKSGYEVTDIRTNGIQTDVVEVRLHNLLKTAILMPFITYWWTRRRAGSKRMAIVRY
jgi:hypothetical protein